VAVDLPYYEHSPHFQSRWCKNLDFEAVKWGTVAKRGVARFRPPCQQTRNISRRPRPLQFHVFNSETADEPVSHAKSHHLAFCGKL
jgi:hypothetical protein